MQKKKIKRVRREAAADGTQRPTARELRLARELAARWQVELPADDALNLRFVRAFLDAFALRGDNPREEVLRRLRNVRALVWDGLDGDALARKLGVPSCLGPVLRAYGRAQMHRRWSPAQDALPGGSPERPLLDRLADDLVDGDGAAWAALAATSAAIESAR